MLKRTTTTMHGYAWGSEYPTRIGWYTSSVKYSDLSHDHEATAHRDWMRC